MKYELMCLLAGVSCKLHDDLEDNDMLCHLKTPFILELLKGFHYILFTCVSLEESLFFYTNFYVNYVHLLVNRVAFTRPYEMSLCFTYGILFFIVNKSQMFLNFNLYDFMSVFTSLLVAGVEHFLCPEEVSFKKLIMRSGLTIAIVSTLWLSWIESKSITYFCYYVLGYGVTSVIIQCYSLFVEKPPSVREEPVLIEKPPLDTEKPPLDTEKPPLDTEKPPLDKEEK